MSTISRNCQYTGTSYDVLASWVVIASSNPLLIGLPPSSIPGSDPTNYVDSLDFSVAPTQPMNSGPATPKTVLNIVTGPAYGTNALVLFNVTATGNLTAVGPSGTTSIEGIVVNGDASLTNIYFSDGHVSGTVTTNGGCFVRTNIGNVYFGYANILGSSDFFGDSGKNVGSGTITIDSTLNIGSATVNCFPTLAGDLRLSSVYIYGSSAPLCTQDFWSFSTVTSRMYIRNHAGQFSGGGPFGIRILNGMVPDPADVRYGVTFDDGTAGTLASTYINAAGTKIAMGADWTEANIKSTKVIAGKTGTAPVNATVVTGAIPCGAL